MSFNDLFGSIPDGWESTTLGNLAQKDGGSIQTGPFGSQLHAADYVDDGVPSIMPKNITIDGVDDSDIARVKPSDIKRLSKYTVEVGDIVYSRRGDVEKCSLITEKESGWLCGTGCLRVRVNDQRVTSEFLHAYLCHPTVREWIVRHAVGATMPNLNTSILSSLPVLIPPKKEVEQISEIWTCLSKKLITNNKTNQTLEQMAQAIFKSWFVDFDPVKAKMNGEQPDGMDEATAAMFPDKLIESEFGLIPEGWDITSIKDFGDVICGKTPSKKNAAFYGGDVPFIKIPDTHGKVFITETTDTLTQAGDASQPKKRIPENSICVSCIATVGQVFITTKPSHTNQQINSVVPNDKNSLYYLLFMFKGLHKHFHDLASGGSATLNMNTSTFSKVALVRPTVDLLEAFHKMVGGLMEKMLANQLENSTLSELRDTLLPKLLSGELSLGQATELTEVSA